MRIKVLSTPVYMVEASDARSWILRNNKVPMIRDPVLIRELVIADPTKEKIEMNRNVLSGPTQLIVEGLVNVRGFNP